MLYFIIFISIIALVIATIRKIEKQKFEGWPDVGNNLVILKDNNKKDKLFTEKCPLIKRKLMTRNEQVIYNLIKAHIPEILIFSQVQLSQLVFYPKNNPKEKYYWNNRINRMSIDLVITNKSFETLLVIEIDDPSHQRADRIEKDKKKNKVLKDAGIKILRIPTGSNPPIEALKRIINFQQKEIIIKRHHYY